MFKRRGLMLLVLCTLWQMGMTATPSAEQIKSLPPTSSNLRLAAPIKTWDEAIPIGNGLLGGLLWGEGRLLKLSLDRGDLWDERPADGIDWKAFSYTNLKAWVAAGRHDQVEATFDGSYGEPHPTKIPAGRLELQLPEGCEIEAFGLDLARAEASGDLKGGGLLRAFASAQDPVLYLRLPMRRTSLALKAPASLAALKYPPAVPGTDGDFHYFIQEAAQGLRYCVACMRRTEGSGEMLAVTVTCSTDAADPIRLARARLRRALVRGYASAFQGHEAWWRAFWSRSAVSIPDSDLLRHYHLAQYFLGSASRAGAPPMPLQGVWTADAGGLPPWKGDYHNDLNTQAIYMSYAVAGRFESGRSLLDHLWNLLPEFRRFARDFYGVEGAAVPGVMTLKGKPLGGWGQYSLDPAHVGWLGQLFHQHWQMTGDERFLRQRAYPWCREMAQGLQALLEPGADGILRLPLSSSPEIHDNGPDAWLKPNSTYDQANLKVLFLDLAEMAEALGKGPEAQSWRDLAKRLGPWQVGPDQVLRLEAEQPLKESHRHLSHLIAIHPFGLIHIDGGPEDRRILGRSIEAWEKLGTSQWCGYSFSWAACLFARVGQPEQALKHLNIYAKAFTLRNGFHANGDQTKSGYSEFTYRPFTLEGNFLAAQALHEMLLQSWNPELGTSIPGPIRVFPATPTAWRDVAFQDLRAEGGFKVTAQRKDEQTVWVRIVATRDGRVRVKRAGLGLLHWNRPVNTEGDFLELQLRAGESLEGQP